MLPVGRSSSASYPIAIIAALIASAVVLSPSYFTATTFESKSRSAVFTPSTLPTAFSIAALHVPHCADVLISTYCLPPFGLTSFP